MTRRPGSGLGLLLLLLLLLGARPLRAAPAAAPSPPPLRVPYVAQPTAVTCVPAAAVMALAAQGLPLDVVDLVRALPVWPDGVSIFDLEDALMARGGHAWVGRGDVALIDALLAVGIPPVLLVAAPDKHALVVAGRSDGRWAVRDPARPEVTSLADGEVAARWEATGRQVLVTTARSLPPRVVAEATRLDLLAGDRRFRATELLLRARAHGEPNDQAMALYARALAEDEGFAALHTDLGIAWCRRGDRDRALAHLRRAVALAPQDMATRKNLEQVRSEATRCVNAAPRQEEIDLRPATEP